MQNRLSVSHVNDSLCDAGCMLLMSTAIPTSPYLSCCMVSKPSNCLRKYSYCSHSSIRQELTCFAASAVVQFLFSPVLLHRNYAVYHHFCSTLCGGAELLSLSELLGLQCFAISRSYRGASTVCWRVFACVHHQQTLIMWCLQVFLWPIGGVVMVALFAVLTNFNPTRFTLSIYFS